MYCEKEQSQPITYFASDGLTKHQEKKITI